MVTDHISILELLEYYVVEGLAQQEGYFQDTIVCVLLVAPPICARRVRPSPTVPVE